MVSSEPEISVDRLPAKSLRISVLQLSRNRRELVESRLEVVGDLLGENVGCREVFQMAPITSKGCLPLGGRPVGMRVFEVQFPSPSGVDRRVVIGNLERRLTRVSTQIMRTRSITQYGMPFCQPRLRNSG